MEYVLLDLVPPRLPTLPRLRCRHSSRRWCRCCWRLCRPSQPALVWPRRPQQLSARCRSGCWQQNLSPSPGYSERYASSRVPRTYGVGQGLLRVPFQRQRRQGLSLSQHRLLILCVRWVKQTAVSKRLLTAVDLTTPPDRQFIGVLGVGGVAGVFANHEAFHAEA